MNLRRQGLHLAQTLALASAFLATPVFADEAETKGGLKITSDDGNFSAALGGRIHFDTYLFDADIEDPVSSTELRRARLTMKGKLWGWEYVLDKDFASSGAGGLRDVTLSTGALGGELKLGHFKPYRSMEEMTSSNEITMMERSSTSATGIYRGRQRQQGIGWHTYAEPYTFGIMAFNMRNAGDNRNEGIGAAGRATWAPLNDDIRTLHLGLSLSHEDANRATAPVEAAINYAGRRGPSQLIASTPGDSEFFFDDMDDDAFYLGDDGGRVNIVGLELAGTYGPLYGQAEYAYGEFDGDYFVSEDVFEDWFDIAPSFSCDPVIGCFIGDQDVRAWYVMGSWMITGEHRPYDSEKGVFRTAKPDSDWGAWELTARYDTMENRDIPGLEASSAIVGVNYYHNPKVRFMLNLVFGDDDFTGDDTKQLAFRAQISW